jgi:hypothetical protein
LTPAAALLAQANAPTPKRGKTVTPADVLGGIRGIQQTGAQTAAEMFGTADLSRVASAQYQASAWLGGGAQTGLKSQADPFVGVVEDRIARTADATGKTRAQVLREFIRGNASLISGAGLATGLGTGEAVQSQNLNP